MLVNLQMILLKQKRSVIFTLNKIFIQWRTFLNIRKKTDYFFCPCCGKHTIDWVDFSSKYTKSVCPHCNSQPRHRLFYLYLQERTNFHSQKLKVLHFAPETILRKKFSSMPNLDYITADLNDPSVEVKIDITNISYPNNTFDVIFCSHVLEHVIDDRKAMRELWRILKPGGWAFLQIPLNHKSEKTFEDPNITSPQERLRYFGQEDHVRYYGLDYKDRLEEAGFIVKIEKYAQELSNDQIKKYGLRSYENLYFGLKS